MDNILHSAVVAVVLIVLVFLLVGERGRLLRRSTWQMFHEAGWRQLLSSRPIHGYIYGRWTSSFTNALAATPGQTPVSRPMFA